MIQHDSASSSFREKHSVVDLKPAKCLSRFPSTYTSPPYPPPSPHQVPWPRVKGHHHHTKSDLSLDSNVTPLKQHITAARAGLAQTVIEMAGGREVRHSASPFFPLHPLLWSSSSISVRLSAQGPRCSSSAERLTAMDHYVNLAHCLLKYPVGSTIMCTYRTREGGGVPVKWVSFLECILI